MTSPNTAWLGGTPSRPRLNEEKGAGIPCFCRRYNVIAALEKALWMQVHLGGSSKTSWAATCPAVGIEEWNGSTMWQGNRRFGTGSAIHLDYALLRLVRGIGPVLGLFMGALRRNDLHGSF